LAGTSRSTPSFHGRGDRIDLVPSGAGRCSITWPTSRLKKAPVSLASAHSSNWFAGAYYVNFPRHISLKAPDYADVIPLAKALVPPGPTACVGDQLAASRRGGADCRLARSAHIRNKQPNSGARARTRVPDAAMRKNDLVVRQSPLSIRMSRGDRAGSNAGESPDLRFGINVRLNVVAALARV